MKASIQHAIDRLPGAPAGAYPEGVPFMQVIANGSMSVEVFAPGSNQDGRDRQQPHSQDELYFVHRGDGEIIINGQRYKAGAGDAFFVGAGVEHRFENFSKDFVTWVVFYGPQGGE
ncbi:MULTISPECIES: cupin domain-containing protein [unclassified Polaromonas]|uniref:cupin domain-containing protein n=1 Tax=unclassified Polaromonas TaxID=2638319 RepID=UPI000F0801BA|nr:MULTISPECIES: cupin domain-containing protein [unclassified Polaromonas]AYQ28120.1 cupin domain-containing protein [Polaromonas sp. SP1]QGJ17016.1 cupin domain-containing protein [Polaromonas sp. Pch-P]